jgi:Uma2 family endonuclease
MATITGSTTSDLPRKFRNAAEWLHHLGDIPLERIIFDPWPGTATEEDLLRKIEAEDQLCELIDGTLVAKPMSAYESLLSMLLVQELLNFIRPRRLGAVIGPDGPLRFRIGLVRLPDIAYISAERTRAGGGVKRTVTALIPDLAVEVLSPGNRPHEMRRKREEYFAAGIRLVWMIDPATRSADAYTTLERFTHIEPEGSLDGGEVLVGFTLSLSELFSAADEAAEGLI